MTTLKELLFSRVCKISLAVMLTASMVPVAALSATPAFAEDAETDATAHASEVTDTEQPSQQAESDSSSAEGDAGEPNDAADAALDERSTYAADGDGEQPESEPSEDPVEPASEPDSEAAAEGDPDENGTTTDVQMESLETTVEEPFSFFAPFRLLFGANDTFTAPLSSGSHENWIDRLDLSGAPYARNFYDILVEASDNDGASDWLIDYGTPNVLNRSNARVGNVYKSPSDQRVIGILAAIVEGNETASGSSLTPTETRVKEYVNEVYGAFDRDYPTSFWRDVKFGTVFWRPADNSGRTYCLFVLKTSDMDIRAKGYRSKADIQQAIADVNADVKKIEDAYTASDLSKNDSEYSRVRFYNQWICENNSYNSKFNSVAHNKDALADFQADNPDVWSAVSALDGRTGEMGPVCEGYARALELLCDKAGIGCVVVDGNTSAGAHMWNYVRVGGDWYGVDITWNDGKADEEMYLLVGSDTKVEGEAFLSSHPATNQFVSGGTKFTNGPELSAEAYNPNNVSFAGIITSSDEFAYGDSFALAYNSTTEGTVEYTVSGPARITEQAASTPAEAAAKGSGPLLTITGLGDITATVTLTPTTGNRATLSDTVTIKGVARPLKVTGTELATKVYDGTASATVKTTGTLASARDLSYAKQGVLEGDALGLKAKSAAYDDKNAGASKTGTVTYELTGSAETLKLYTLEGNESGYATGTITKRPATAYFALTSTRMLLDETPPTGTVRYEAFDDKTARGKVEGDDLTPTGTIKIDGLPNPIAPGTYDITWAKPNDYVLNDINKLPAAANYDIALAEGDADEAVTLEVVNLANTVVIDAAGATDETSYRVEARVDGINDDTVTKLADSGFTSVESITAKLIEALTNQTENLSSDRVVVYDMTLYVPDDKGAWTPATVDNFPAGGVRVTLDYPEGTEATQNSFYAAHMFTAEVTSGGTVHQPGEVETPQVLNTDEGVTFTLMGFSPVSLAWDNTPANVTPTQTGASIANGAANGSGSELNTTGDSLLVVGVIAVAAICVALIAFLLIRRKKDRRA